jgi:RND family efflux transporter MFP subunit
VEHLKKFHIVGIIVALALTPGCGRQAAEPAKPEQALAVRVAVVAAAEGSPAIEAVGTAAWRNETALSFTNGGQIARIMVNEGDRVKQGQLLAILNTTTVQADLSGAEAQAARDGSNSARIAELYREGWVTKAQFEASQANAKTSAAQVQARRFAVDTAKITAPSSGIVLARLAEAKQVVGAGAAVLTIGEDRGGHIIRVPLNDRAASAIRLGAPATIYFEALGKDLLQGRVVEIGGKARQSTGTFDVEIALPPDPRLRSGMVGTVSIISSAKIETPRLFVPAGALLSPRGGEALVYVIGADKRARLRTVQIGDPTDSGVEIVSGLAVAEMVALTGFDKLQDGLRVIPMRRAP